MKNKIDLGTIKRVISYLKHYKVLLIIAIVTIIINTISNVAGTLFLETLIDDYVTPLIGADNPVYTELAKAIGILSMIYIIQTIIIY